jgi:dTMP kinase
MKKGLFIVIEGIDGSGKGTQSKKLYKWLKRERHESYLTYEPTDGIIGRVIREGLKKGSLDPVTEALLFAADRREHQSEISSEIENGKIVVCDRYLSSSAAYQGAHGIDIEWIDKINNFALKPDLLIILDVKPELALKRINSRGAKTDYFEKVEFLRKVREIYLTYSEAWIVDASRSVEEVHEEIKGIVKRSLLKRNNRNWGE